MLGTRLCSSGMTRGGLRQLNLPSVSSSASTEAWHAGIYHHWRCGQGEEGEELLARVGRQMLQLDF